MEWAAASASAPVSARACGCAINVATRMDMSGSSPIRAVLLAGPTASGKSALALRIAEEWGGSIVNADSMQVYADLREVTARPSEADEQRVPHRLYGHVNGANAYSVGAWLRDMQPLIEGAEGPLVIVGGTGLYFTALTEGLAEVPPTADDVRARWRVEARDQPSERLWRELYARDPRSAEVLAPTDRQRIVRSLEVLESTGRPIADWPQAQPLLPFGSPVVPIILMPERDVLRSRIEQRFTGIVDGDGVAEVEALLKRDLDVDLPVMRAIGVREIAAMLRGEIDRERAVELAVTATRQYAKRQRTWFRNRFGHEWRRVVDMPSALRLIRQQDA